jgi:hypothetical protein
VSFLYVVLFDFFDTVMQNCFERTSLCSVTYHHIIFYLWYVSVTKSISTGALQIGAGMGADTALWGASAFFIWARCSHMTPPYDNSDIIQM